MKAICLDGAMSSVRCVWCKQLHLSGYVKPWDSHNTHNTQWDPQPPQSKAQQPLTDLCSVKSFLKTELHTSFMRWSLSDNKSSKGWWTLTPQITAAENMLDWSACSVVISYIRVWQEKACALIIPLGAQGQLLHTYTHTLQAIDSICSIKCPLTQSTAHPIRYIREILYYWPKLREYRQFCEKLDTKQWQPFQKGSEGTKKNFHKRWDRQWVRKQYWYLRDFNWLKSMIIFLSSGIFLIFLVSIIWTSLNLTCNKPPG